ncbi:DNA-binding protein WhiA [Mycolicibacterium sp. Y3]
MTNAVKAELSRVVVESFTARRAEVATVMRFAGEILAAERGLVVEADLASEDAARRLHGLIHELFDPRVALRRRPGHSEWVSSSYRRHELPCFAVEVSENVVGFAQRVGLVDRRGRRIRGLPPSIIAGDRSVMIAVWRGAFLAGGNLRDPGRPRPLQVRAPSHEAAVAVVGAARRLGIEAKTREVRGADLVVVSDSDAIASLLLMMGAAKSKALWDRSCERRRADISRGGSGRGLGDRNAQSSIRAAESAAMRIERALQILGDSAPADLVEAGRLRITHRSATLEELGRLADPALSKDAIAGRIRRLLAKADRHASLNGLPDTHSVMALQPGA